jgi:DNA-binding CsgD family transcriptional regulator/PAS domain-containing protein
MQYFTTQDWKAVIKVIEIANSRLEPVAMRQNVLNAMQKLFNIERGNFYLSSHDWRNLDLNTVVSLDIDKRYNDQYAQNYYQFSPALRPENFRKSVFSVDRVISDSDWVRSEFYDALFRPQNIHYELVIHPFRGARSMGLLALFRSKKAGGFNERDMLVARRLVHPLAIALDNVQLVSRIKTDLDQSRAAIESFQLGLVLLDNEVRPVYWNPKAKQIFLSLAHKPNGVDEMGSGALPIPSDIEQDCLALKQLFENRSQILPLSRIRTIGGEGDRRFEVMIYLTQEPCPRISNPCFVVSIEDILQTGKIRKDTSRMKYHLTSREAEIASLVSQGFTNREIAKSLSISQLTVETHMKNIFEKVRVRNRVGLSIQLRFS